MVIGLKDALALQFCLSDEKRTRKLASKLCFIAGQASSNSNKEKGEQSVDTMCFSGL